MNDITAAVARNVKRLRKQRGLTIAKLGELAVVSRFTILAIEAGKRPSGRKTMISLDTAARLAYVLGVTLNDLVESDS